MVDKYEVGELGQLVTGGTVNEGSKSHLSNILNLSLNGKEPRPITDLQRKAISAKVNDLLSISGLARLDVYKIILTDTGVDKIAELPRDSYHDVMAMLNGWIKEATVESGSCSEKATEQPIEPPSTHCHCDLSGQLARTRYMIGLVGMTIASSIFGSAWLLSRDADEATQVLCHFDGRGYSIGSVVTMEGEQLKCQAKGNGFPGWVNDAVTR